MSPLTAHFGVEVFTKGINTSNNIEGASMAEPAEQDNHVKEREERTTQAPAEPPSSEASVSQEDLTENSSLSAANLEARSIEESSSMADEHRGYSSPVQPFCMLLLRYSAADPFSKI